MANRGPEPESMRQQFSQDYLEKYGDPGPLPSVISFDEIVEDIVDVVSAVAPEPLVSIPEPVISIPEPVITVSEPVVSSPERETVTLKATDIKQISAKELWGR